MNPTCPAAPRQPIPKRLCGHESPATRTPIRSPGSFFSISSTGGAPGCRAGAAIILWDENPRRTYSESAAQPEKHIAEFLNILERASARQLRIKKSSTQRLN